MTFFQKRNISFLKLIVFLPTNKPVYHIVSSACICKRRNHEMYFLKLILKAVEDWEAAE